MYNTEFCFIIKYNGDTEEIKFTILDLENLNEDQLDFQVGAQLGNILRYHENIRFNDVTYFGIYKTTRFDKIVELHEEVNCYNDLTFCYNKDNRFVENMRVITNNHIKHVRMDLENCISLVRDMVDAGMVRIDTNIVIGNSRG